MHLCAIICYCDRPARTRQTKNFDTKEKKHKQIPVLWEQIQSIWKSNRVFFLFAFFSLEFDFGWYATRIFLWPYKCTQCQSSLIATFAGWFDAATMQTVSMRSPFIVIIFAFVLHSFIMLWNANFLARINRVKVLPWRVYEGCCWCCCLLAF